jgi:MoaA/NifB/PqqE/SkfB family radical SAM enzyme
MALHGLRDTALLSLPGIDGTSHAFCSGRPGTLRAMAAAVKALRAAAVNIVRAGSVISAPLIKDFSRWHKAVSRMGFDIWELYRPMMTEQALAVAPEFSISRTELSLLARKISAQEPGAARAVLANPVPFCAIPAAARPFALGARFDDGWTRLVLDASGNYKPSYPSRRFLGRELAAAWNSPFLKKTRAAAWLPRACRNCRMLNTCLAGSRFQAQIAGNAFGRDPWMAAR